MPFPIGDPLEPSLYLTVSEIFNVECKAMVDMTLIQPLNKGQFHSFWYQSISHIWDTHWPFPIGGPLEPSLHL